MPFSKATSAAAICVAAICVWDQALAIAATANSSRLAVASVHRRHPHRAFVPRHDGGSRYGYSHDPTPTCRYPDGTPYDPDIIGGPNHVGDGGPAANLGGFDPCGY